MHSLAARGVECFLPIYEAMSSWKDRQVLLERPLFSGYGFVRLAAADRVSVLAAPGVVQVLCTRPLHDAIGDDFIAALRQGLCAGRTEPHPYFAVGEQVSIVKGPFAGMQGVLLRHKKPTLVIISVPGILRAFSVEIDVVDLRRNPTIVPAGLARQSAAYGSC